MADENTQTATTDTEKPAQPVKLGAPVRAELPTRKAAPEPVSADNVQAQQSSPQNDGNASDNTDNNDSSNEAAIKTDPNTANATTKEPQPPANNDKEPEINEEALKAYFEKQGIQFEGIDKLKEKLTAPAAPPVLTDDQRAEQQRQYEQRMLNEHLSRVTASNPKLTPAQAAAHFAEYQQLLSTDKKVVALNKTVQDLVSEGHKPEAALKLANDMYFQKTDEEIDEITDEDERNEAIERKKVGDKKLEKKGEKLQKVVQDYFDSIKQSLVDQDAEKELTEKHAANVANAVAKYQRKQQLKLGQRNGVDLSPVDFDVPDEALTLAKEYIGTDPKQLHKKLFTESGEVNISELLPILVNHFAFEQAAKTGYYEGETRATSAFEAKFGTTPPSVGGNGKQQAPEKGKIARAGKPVFVNTSRP